MAFGDHLLHTCTIQRADKTQMDAYQQAKPVWADLETGIACRLVERTQRIVNDERTQLTAVTAFTLLLPAGTDILEDDRVTDLADGGVVFDAGPYHVTAVLRRRAWAEHHVSVALERVT